MALTFSRVGRPLRVAALVPNGFALPSAGTANGARSACASGEATGAAARSPAKRPMSSDPAGSLTIR
jgi:hypothetical protein